MAEPPKYPTSRRTIFPRSVEQPLRGEKYATAKKAEAERKRHDPTYITADEARKLPQEAAERPEIRFRIESSRSDWPENRASATIALGALVGGSGETVEERPLDAEVIFDGSRADGGE